MGDDMKYEYRANVTRVVDGDTLDLTVDLGFKVSVRIRARLYGVDTPETFGVKKESDEYKAGVAAREFVEEWLGMVIPAEHENFQHRVLTPPPVIIRSFDGKPLGQGKYGRWLVEVVRLDPEAWEGSDNILNEALINNGHAKRVVY